MHIHKSILYVEDEPDIRETYERALQSAGYRVYTAHQAQYAIDVLDTFLDIRLVIVDLFLPEHNGLAILQYLQSYRDWQDIPVFILSSHSRDRLKAEDSYLEDLGIVEYLQKTTTPPRILVEKVKEKIGGNQT